MSLYSLKALEICSEVFSLASFSPDTIIAAPALNPRSSSHR